MTKSKIEPSYIITTGWWCEETEDKNNRESYNGSDEIRKVGFFDKWYSSVKKYCSPQEIVLIDSASPVLPNLTNKADVKIISLSLNAGHSSNHVGNFCGVTRAHILGMSYALCCDVEYWVYIEQDALIQGENIIEEAIEKNRKNIILGNGWKTPQPTQQSMMIMHKSEIPKFIENYQKIKKKDSEISPEMKFAISSTIWAQYLPEFIFLEGKNNSKLRGYWLRILNYAFNNLGGYGKLPFGYGRERPINFNDKHYYFQHGSIDELRKHESKENH
ncbi:hypothetical protein [Vibrio cyclitrophicus]|uniref:hypothetical protein n=1 Tax=Vibrio cyclitrophicus TaxID=47951 RepID=UPI00399B5172